MSSEKDDPEKDDAPAGGAFGRAVTSGKDLVAAARDALLLAVVSLLLFCPKTANRILTEAGFDHGSVMGLEWKARLTESTTALRDTHDGISQLQAQNGAMARELNDLHAKTTDPAIKEQIATLTAKNTQLSIQAGEMQTSVAHVLKDNASLVAQEGEPAPASTTQPAGYLVGLQTLGISDGERQALNQKLREAGYRLHGTSASYQFAQRPPWFAPRSTVFYYAVSAVPAADSLAQRLKQLTGQDFVTQLGAGSGVEPGQRAITLFVDYVKSGT
jgi:hypothetical protein